MESIFSIANSSDDNASVNGRDVFYDVGTRRWPCDVRLLRFFTIPSFGEVMTNDAIYYSIGSLTNTISATSIRIPTTREEYAPIIRYAEVLLNEAEAAARQGDKDLALKKLNEVRDRSLADPASQTYKANDFADTKALTEAILWERRIEFHGEGRRWEDIHRLAADDLCPSGGIPAKIEYNNTKGQGAFVVGGEVKSEWFGSNKAFIPYTDKRFIWPIPQNDLLRNPHTSRTTKRRLVNIDTLLFFHYAGDMRGRDREVSVLFLLKRIDIIIHGKSLSLYSQKEAYSLFRDKY